MLCCMVACNPNDDDAPKDGEQEQEEGTEIPVVTREATYEVAVTESIVYAEGLRHETINGEVSSTKLLELDAYVPQNDSKKRPAILLIHGGSFTTGSRSNPGIVRFAEYFASRGWVAFSISYRLEGDMGTVPQAWVDYIERFSDPAAKANAYKLYPAHRDAKAALRWVVANSEIYAIDTDYLTVGGGSAGAITAIGISVTDLEDYADEIGESADPTLTTTNREEVFKVKTILDFWGSDLGVAAVNMVYGKQGFDGNDPPIFIAHGTEDQIVLYSEGEALRDICLTTGIDHVMYPLEGEGHSPWNATVDGKRLEELALDFMLEQQDLKVAE